MMFHRTILILMLAAPLIWRGVAAEELSSAEFCAKVSDLLLSDHDKAQLLFKFNGVVDAKEADTLHQYLKTISVELLPSLARVLARQHAEKTFQELLAQVRAGPTDAERAVKALSACWDTSIIKHFGLRQATQRAADAYLTGLNKALGTEAFSTLSDISFDTDMMYLSGGRPDLMSRFALKLLDRHEPPLRQMGVQWLQYKSPFGQLPFLAMISTAEVPSLIKLCESANNEEAVAAQFSLELISHFRPALSPGQKPSDAWNSWWQEHQAKFSVFNAAIAAAGSANTAIPERLFAVQQLNIDHARETDQLRAFTALKGLLSDKTAPFEVRREALFEITASERVLLPGELRKQAIPVFLSLLADGELRDWFLKESINLKIVDIPEIRAQVLALVTAPDTPRPVKAHAAGTLAAATNPRDCAPAILKLLESELALPADDVSRDVCSRLAINALKTITGKDFGADVAAWARELKGEPQPEAAVAAPTRKEERFQVVPVSIASLRRYDFASRQVLPGTLQMQVRVIYSQNIHVVASSGYIIDQLLTDGGERIKSDWQAAAGGFHFSNYWWERREPVNAENKMTSLDMGFDLGQSLMPFKAIKVLKGELIMKTASGTQKIERPAKDLVGKPLADALVRDLRFRVNRMAGRTVEFQHSMEPAHFSRIKQLQFVDENGDAVEFKIVKEMDTKQKLYLFTCTLNSAPEKVKIQLDVFDTVGDERIPFEFTNVPFEPVIEKPPAPQF
jgi:hypothetical protein